MHCGHKQKNYQLKQKIFIGKTLDLMVIQVLNSKLGITLRVSVTSATIFTSKRTIHKNT